MKIQEKLRYLEDRWDDQVARSLDAPSCCAIAPTYWGPICASRTLGEGTPAPKSRTPIHWMAPDRRFCGSKGAVEISVAFNGQVSRRYISGSSTLYQSDIAA